jgi:ubiquinone/menaquinone biosynthesis C-methylase UbiE
MDSGKKEIQRQWDNDPCGAVYAQKQPAGTLQFFRAVREFRYDHYGRWFKRVINFTQYHNQDVLEVGVGLGSDHFSLASQSNRMTALDLSKEHLRLTIQHLHLEKLSSHPVFGDAERMPFADESFDLVYSFGVLHHTPDIASSIAEIHRVLRPGGEALIALYNRDSWFFWLQTILHNGLIKGGLWRKGRRQLFSEIEYRSDHRSAQPIVNVYTRGQLRRLFNMFGSVGISSCHVEASHFSILFFLARHFSEKILFNFQNMAERLLGFAGWYLVVRARK